MHDVPMAGAQKWRNFLCYANWRIIDSKEENGRLLLQPNAPRFVHGEAPTTALQTDGAFSHSFAHSGRLNLGKPLGPTLGLTLAVC